MFNKDRTHFFWLGYVLLLQDGSWVRPDGTAVYRDSKSTALYVSLRGIIHSIDANHFDPFNDEPRRPKLPHDQLTEREYQDRRCYMTHWRIGVRP